MATAETPRTGGDDRGDPIRDIDVTPEDLSDLITGIASAFYRPEDAEQLMIAIQFPRQRRPNFALDMTRAWNEVFNDLDSGVLPSATPYRTILLAALRVFADQRLLRPLAVRHGLIQDGPPRAVPEPAVPTPDQSAVAPAPACHVIVRAGTEEERQHAEQQLRSLGLGPQEMWSTGTAVSYRVSSDDSAAIRADVSGTDLGWTIVAPGQPDYLLQELFVEGPDRRRFRIRDAPAQQTISNLAGEILEGQYPRPGGGATVPITVDHVDDTGETQRVDADDTLHDAGVRDGDTLRVGYQTNAGSVHPDEHESALYRRPSVVQIEAGKLRLITDRRLGKESPEWLKRVAQGLPAQPEEAAATP